jgi:hypothetical protein
MPTEKDSQIVIPRRVDYFEVGIFAYASLYGVVSIVNYGELAARSVRVYPGIGGVVFLALLAVGGLTGLISFAYKTITGPKLELASLTLLVVLCIAYSLWTPFSVGWQGIGLILSMALLIAGPGYFACKRLAKYIHELEDIQDKHRMGGEESGTSDTNHAMDSRYSWRWRRR